jgi:hypothetical protein
VSGRASGLTPCRCSTIGQKRNGIPQGITGTTFRYEHRHFPQRSDLVAAVFRHELDACADAAPALAGEHEPGEALERWLQRYTSLLATKRGLAAALHSEAPAFEALPACFQEPLLPALTSLLEAAAAAGQARADVEPSDLLQAVASLCLPAADDAGHTQRMVALLTDGLRYGATAPPMEQ